MFIRNSQFSCLWLGFLISSLGDWLYRLALPLIILEKTGSAYHAATVFGLSFIPWIFFSLLGGSLADNYSKKKILISGNIAAALASSFLIFTLLERTIDFRLLYAAVFVLASVDPLIHPSFQSIIPEITTQDQFASANSAIQMVDNTLSIMGPLLGGSLVAFFGGISALWIDAVSFLATASILIRLPTRTKPLQTTHTLNAMMHAMVVGAKYSLQQKVIFSGSLMFLFTNFALNMFEANFMFYMTKTLNYSVINTTVAMALGGGGALAASLVGSMIVNHFKAGFLLSASTILAGLSTLLLVTSTNYICIGLILAMVSFFGTLNVITYFTLRQRTVPQNILGRVVAVTRMVSYASIPVGSWFGGVLLAHGQSMASVILLAGIIRTLAGLGANLSPLGREK